MDLRGLDLNLLMVFDVMYEERRTTAAAERLRVSQPTVSFSLGKLREFFADELFVRVGAGMQPTPFAERLREPIRRIISTVLEEVVRAPEFEPRATRRRFTISTSDIGELVFVPTLLRALRAEAPEATLRCLSMPPRDLIAAMADGAVDLAVGYFPDLTGTGFYQQQLFEHPFACLVRSGHPAIGDAMTLEQFLAADHAVVVQEGRSQEIFERRMEELRLERRVLVRSPHFMSVPFLIAASDMIATVPRAVGTQFAGLEALRLLEPPVAVPSIPLRQYWHRRVHLDAPTAWLRRLIARLFLGRDPSSAARNATAR